MRYEENSLNLQPKKKIDTMTSKICRLCILLPLLLMSFSARGANAINMPEFYSRWDGYGNDKLMSMGRLFLNQRFNIDSALVCYSIVANQLQNNVHDKQDANLYIRALNNLGYLYYTYYNDHVRADALFDEGIALSKKFKEDSHLPYLYLNKGNVTYIYETIKGQKQSEKKIIDNFKKTFHSGVEQQAWDCVTASFYGLATFYINMGTRDISPIRKEVETYARLNIPDSTALKDIAQVYLSVLQAYGTHRYEQSIALLEKQLEDADFMQHVHFDQIANTYSTIIRLCRMVGQHEKVAHFCNEFESFVKDGDNMTSKVQAYSLLQEIYQEAGQTDLAQHYEYLKLKVKDEFQEQHQLGDMEQNRFLRQLTQVSDELLAEQTENHWKTIVLLIISIAFVLLVVSLYYIVRSLRRQRRYVNVLYEKNQRLLESSQLLSRSSPSSPISSHPSPTTDDAPQESDDRGEKMAPQTKEAIKHSILEVMSQHDVICQTDFTLSTLCQLSGYSHSYVSQVIRETWDTNFNALLNDYRIKEACRCMNDIEHYGNYTIEAIATTVGFSSRSHFSTIFKKVTGMTAAEYFKTARRKAAESNT